MKSFLKWLIVIVACGLLAACNYPGYSNNNANPASGQQTAVGYPANPEEVVKAFLSDYQENPDQMQQYLSQRAIAHLPAGGSIGLLQFNGALAGFSIQAGSFNQEQSLASVRVDAEVGQAAVSREMVLLKENNRWVIDAIRKIGK